MDRDGQKSLSGASNGFEQSLRACIMTVLERKVAPITSEQSQQEEATFLNQSGKQGVAKVKALEWCEDLMRRDFE